VAGDGELVPRRLFLPEYFSKAKGEKVNFRLAQEGLGV